MYDTGASDLHTISGNPPILRIRGDMERVKYKVLEHQELKAMLFEICPEDKAKIFEETGDIDFGYEIPGLARYRVNFYMQKNGIAAVFRQIPSKILTVEELGLSPTVSKLVLLKKGLVLVTGPTGSGKSTTLAAIVDHANKVRRDNIITIEDPVEFIHQSQNCVISHREVGRDTRSFAAALRGALREDPDIILVSEMRDRETLEIGLSAAETGHLVLSTLHTVDAGQTINRVIGMFDKDEERMVRMCLADTLRWVISQRLLPRVGGGRVAALEIMGMNLRIEEVILNGESEGKTFYEIIQDGEALGMQTFDTHILRLFQEGLITEETALSYASKRSVVARGLDTIKATKGEKTSDIEGLALDADYGRKPRQPGVPLRPGPPPKR